MCKDPSRHLRGIYTTGKNVLVGLINSYTVSPFILTKSLGVLVGFCILILTKGFGVLGTAPWSISMGNPSGIRVVGRRLP